MVGLSVFQGAQNPRNLGADRSEVLCRVIKHGLVDWRQEQALEKLREHSITLRMAAELADVSSIEMVTLATDEGIDINYSPDELVRDLERI